MAQELSIGFVGNPNCGKTTLFNAYTGANLKVANWPGVTVEKKEGRFQFHDQEYMLVDLPGTYSLTSYTMEEQVTRQYIMSDDVDVIIDVADASALGRNLYLTLQLIELGKPVILALNMMDIVEKRGMEIDTHRLPEMLGIPVIPVSARRKTGLDILMHAAAHHKEHRHDIPLIHHHGEEEPQTLQTKHQHHHHALHERAGLRCQRVLFRGGNGHQLHQRHTRVERRHGEQQRQQGIRVLGDNDIVDELGGQKGVDHQHDAGAGG